MNINEVNFEKYVRVGGWLPEELTTWFQFYPADLQEGEGAGGWIKANGQWLKQSGLCNEASLKVQKVSEE